MDGASESVAGSDTAGDNNDGIVIGDRDDAKEEIMTTSDNPNEEQPDDENNNNVDFEEEEPETQESFTQHEMTQTGNELTQMGLFDDDDDGNDCNDDDDEDANSRQPMIDPLTLPWGRLMPVGSNGDNTVAVSTAAASIAAAATSSLRPSTREAIEMLPRPPETRTITRSRSPSLDNGRLSSSSSNSNHDISNSQSEDGLTFLGLNNLLPSDRFNEYVLGRSAKVSLLSFSLTIVGGFYVVFYLDFNRLTRPLSYSRQSLYIPSSNSG